jgi:hypothetical protein
MTARRVPENPSGTKKRLIDIRRTGRGQLRNLFIPLRLERLADSHEHFFVTQVLARIVMIGIGNVEEARGQGSSSTTSGVGEFEGGYVGNYSKQLQSKSSCE